MNIIWLNSGWFKVKYNIKKLVVDNVKNHCHAKAILNFFIGLAREAFS